MRGNPKSGLINRTRSFTVVCAFFILALGGYSCQTTPDQPDQAAREKQILESQKAIIRTALDSGRPDAALKSIRELIRQYPDDSSLQNLMGLTQLSLKNPGRAAKHFKIAYKLDKSPAIALNISSAEIEAGNFDAAVELLRALLKSDGKNSQPYAYKERIYHNLGYAYAKQNQNTKAAQHFNEALEENPTFFPSHLELARIYEKTKRPAMAIKSYRQAVDHCDVCYEPVQALVMLYMKQKRFPDARRLLIQFGKVEGVTTTDRVAADRLLKVVTTAGLNIRQSG